MSGADKKLVSVGIDINPDNGFERARSIWQLPTFYWRQKFEAFYNEVLLPGRFN